MVTREANIPVLLTYIFWGRGKQERTTIISKVFNILHDKKCFRKITMGQRRLECGKKCMALNRLVRKSILRK